ncbi:MAG: ketopantoate reductase family protein [Myxococcaceae bacterium]|nr:ketopantoate reductase family protein [Myxococcaceae bacterium]
MSPGQARTLTVVGAGAIGSALALYLSRAGHQVTVVARGERLRQLRADGAIVTTRGERAPVHVADEVAPADLLLVPVRPWQVDALLPPLRAAASPVMFMFNAWTGVPALRDAVGRERFAWGFPAIVAALRAGKLEARVVPRALARLQITSLGALPDFRPAWLDGWAATFTAAGIPTVECDDMQAWLATHAAVMGPLMAAGVIATKRGLSSTEARAVVDAWRAGFTLVRARGLEVTPGALASLINAPAPLLSALLWLASRVGALAPLGDNGADEPRFLLDAMAGDGLATVLNDLTP